MFKFSSQSPSGKKNHNHRFTNIMEWREENHIKINVRFWSWKREKKIKKKNTWSRSRLGMEARGWNGWRWRWGGQIKRRLEAFVNLFFFFFSGRSPLLLLLLLLLCKSCSTDLLPSSFSSSSSKYAVIYIYFTVFRFCPTWELGTFGRCKPTLAARCFNNFFFFGCEKRNQIGSNSQASFSTHSQKEGEK